MEVKQSLGDQIDDAISEVKDKENAEKKKSDKVKGLKVVASLVPWKKGEPFSTYKQHLESMN